MMPTFFKTMKTTPDYWPTVCVGLLILALVNLALMIWTIIR